MRVLWPLSWQPSVCIDRQKAHKATRAWYPTRDSQVGTLPACLPLFAVFADCWSCFCVPLHGAFPFYPYCCCFSYCWFALVWLYVFVVCFWTLREGHSESDFMAAMAGLYSRVIMGYTVVWPNSVSSCFLCNISTYFFCAVLWRIVKFTTNIWVLI